MKICDRCGKALGRGSGSMSIYLNRDRTWTGELCGSCITAIDYAVLTADSVVEDYSPRHVEGDKEKKHPISDFLKGLGL